MRSFGYYDELLVALLVTWLSCWAIGPFGYLLGYFSVDLFLGYLIAGTVALVAGGKLSEHVDR